ncbi:outer membrane protein assembly factor BamE [bacterium]|nr:outer membrane protein assembly factor BamE [bacterium]
MTFDFRQGRGPERGPIAAVPKGRLGRVAASFVRTCAALAVVLAVACTPIYSNHGFIPEEDDLAQIKTGVDTRDTVGAFLGRPSTEGVLGDNEWFYVQSRWKTVGGREPQEINRQVVAISFDAKGKVSNIERFGLEKGEVVAITRRITTEPIRGRSALAQIFANFGRIDPASLLPKN